MRKHHLKRGRHGPPKKLLLLALTLAVVIAGAATAIGGVLYIYNDYGGGFKSPQDVSVNQPYAGARIYDRNGQFLYEFVDENHGVRRPVPLSEISPYVVAATVATEDSSFFENAGVNVKGLARATWENVSPLASNDQKAFEGSGGSSITQQLVKNLYIPQDERADRSISRKIKETVYALELTQRYSKDQILEWYLNQISYGGIYYGIEAASEGYFGKHASELTLAEAAMLAGLPQSPSQFDPVVHPEAAKARRDQVLELMRSHRGIQLMDGQQLDVPDSEIDAAKQAEVVLHDASHDIRAPHFIFSQVKPQLEALFGTDAIYRDGLTVTTTIDINMQDAAQAQLESHIEQFEDVSNSRNGAAIVIEPKTGEIWGYIGSRDYFREDIQGRNDNLISLNSPGSSFKPFVYLTSFLKLGWSPGTVIEDSPTVFRESNGTTFSPTNPNHQYNGPISIRDSLGNSLNVTAFKTAAAVGIPAIVDTARQFGFTTLNGQYGPSISVGGVDLTALDLTYGYSVLANNGVMHGADPIIPDGVRDMEPISILKVTNTAGEVLYDVNQHRRERRVVPAEYTYMITSILTDPNAECITFGCGGIKIPDLNVAVKTGTSEPFDENSPNAGKIGDTWGFGYTPDLAVGVWAGNADNSPIVNIFSTSISYRAMRDILVQSYGGGPRTPFQQPQGLEISNRCSHSSIAIGCKPDLVIKQGYALGSETAFSDQPKERGAQQSPTPGPGQEQATPTPSLTPGPEATATPSPQPPTPQASGSIRAAITGVGSGPAISIIGTATSPNMTSYTLDFQKAGTNIGGTIGSWSSPVVNGQLGAWPASGLPPGQYVVRLTVFDALLGSSSSTVTVTIR